MDIVVIPFNFEKLSPAEQVKVVPICVTRKDRHGNNIAWGWFEAVSKIQAPLRSLARRFLYDVWRTSEIADLAVQSVWDSHGEDFGQRPRTANLRSGKMVRSRSPGGNAARTPWQNGRLRRSR